MLDAAAAVGFLVFTPPVGGADVFPATPFLTGLTGERGILLPGAGRERDEEPLVSGCLAEGGGCLLSRASVGDTHHIVTDTAQ